MKPSSQLSDQLGQHIQPPNQIGTWTMQPSTLLTQPRNRPYNERLEVHTSIASHLLELSGIPSPSSGRSAKPSRIGAAISSAHAQNWPVAPPPPTTTVPSDMPTRQPSGNPQRPHAVGKPLHLGVIRTAVKPRRLAEGGIDVACSQARSKQVQYLNAQQAHLECEIEKEFLSGYHAKQNYDDLSDLAPVEVATPELQPVIVDEMLMLLSISMSANLQHHFRLLCREFSDIFSSTVREHPAVVPPLSMSVNKDRWADLAWQSPRLPSSTTRASLLRSTSGTLCPPGSYTRL
jgi:hypothetical protein